MIINWAARRQWGKDGNHHMRRNNGYGSYRGKSKFRTFLKIVIAVLLIVLVLLVAAFFFLQQYMVVSADGIRFEIPFFQEQQPSPSQSAPVIVESRPPVIVTPSPTPEPEPKYTRMISLPGDVLHDDNVKGLFDRYLAGDAAVEETYPGFGSATQLIFNMKGYDGNLGYISDVPLAREIKASGADAGRQDGIVMANDINGGVLYNAAYLSCFRDNTAPYNRNSLALRTNIGNWRGPGDIRWMSPQVEAARQYVIDLCAELIGKLQFTDLILDNAAFPSEGNLNLLVEGERYNPATLTDTITGFYSDLRQTLDNTPKRDYPPFRLGIVTDKTTLDDGVNPLTGQTLDALCRYAERIYVDLEGADIAGYYDKLKAAGLEHPEENLIVILDAPPAGDVAYSWAVLPE